jgi:hypothetical protein
MIVSKSHRSSEGLKLSPGEHGAGRSSSYMQFCPKCSLALVPTKKEKIVVLIPKCGVT